MTAPAESGQDRLNEIFRGQAKNLLATVPPDANFDHNPWNEDNLSGLLAGTQQLLARRNTTSDALAIFNNVTGSDNSSQLILTIAVRDIKQWGEGEGQRLKLPMDPEFMGVIEGIQGKQPPSEENDLLFFSHLDTYYHFELDEVKEDLKKDKTAYGEPQKIFPL